MASLKITFLGTGTSQGVPLIGCSCRVCRSTDSRDKRLRSSILVESAQTTLVIDSGPDFRQQLLREEVCKLDALVFTHSHKDHVAGMDDVRAFNYLQEKPMDVYATEATQCTLRGEFPYIFSGEDYPGIPQIDLHTIEAGTDFEVGDIHIQPIEVYHYKMPVLGFRMGSFTYITDANAIAETELEKIMGTEILVLNALRRETHISHFTLDEAIALAQQIKPRICYLTHISHQLGLHEEVSRELPPGIALASDRMTIET